MASESAPFLSDNEHDDDYERQSNSPKSPAASTYFKRPLKILGGLTALTSVLTFALLIAIYILISIAPFENSRYDTSSADTVRDLAIVLFTTTFLLTPHLFLTLPAIIPLITDLVMTIVIFVFTAELLSQGYPSYSSCSRYRPYDPSNPYHRDPLPEKPECVAARDRICVMMGVAGIMGIAVGLLSVGLVILRAWALVKTKFWVGRMGSFKGWGLPGKGFEISFSLKIVRAGEGSSERVSEEERLIET
ncbi:hypothetical protein GLAREA_11407 [Glarea lozoyensis ATCC 20868]|uniref:MARVEL domain-containing protein n=2 Tax=Glarea lozoyensis TaxID=101852 RepID=S3CYE8_GLAL2|nr:uncharacterized protein GLAREA_11407 [Glarea lozoyensis ATCC 20868]EHL01424.1 hypothetical protein M7I_2513 [Glarea lozoyensis 74030]EPE24826.1 hypothetical protein GLAREA_11407 [Glarea lozoyensis ATCC 20868]